MQLLFSFDRAMRVEKTLMQTLASQLSSTLMQLLFSYDQGMRVEKTLMQTLVSQLSSTLQGVRRMVYQTDEVSWAMVGPGCYYNKYFIFLPTMN
jgi:hypothetical protein